MSAEHDPLIEFIRSINPIDARRALHASQQGLRRIDIDFVERLLPLVQRTHPEALTAGQTTLHRSILIDALRKLAAANAELLAMAEREYDQQVSLQTMAILHPEYESLAPYRLQHGAVVNGPQSTKE